MTDKNHLILSYYTIRTEMKIVVYVFFSLLIDEQVIETNRYFYCYSYSLDNSYPFSFI